MSKTKKHMSTTSRMLKSESARSTQLSIYQAGGQAVIQETRELDLVEGSNKVQLAGIAATYQPNSLRVCKAKSCSVVEICGLKYRKPGGDDIGSADDTTGPAELNIGPVSYRSANLDLANVLKESVGKKVSFQQEAKHGRSSHQTSGTIIAVLGNNALAVRRDDNKRVVMLNFNQVEFADGLPDGLSSTPSLVMNPEVSTSDTYEVEMLYEAHGFSWSPRYSLFYDDALQVVTRMECSVIITNSSGATFENATVKLLAGSNYARRGAVRGMSLEAAPMAAMAAGRSASISADSMTAESVGEMKMYELPELVTLSHGEALQTNLFMAENVPVKRKFVLPGSWNWSTQNEKQAVYVQLAFTNKVEGELGYAFPTGEVDIFQNDLSGSAQKTGNANISAAAPGEDFTIQFGPSSDIKAERRLVSAKEDPMPPRQRRGFEASDESQEKPRYREELREITIHNFKKSGDAEVTVEDFIPEGAEIINQDNAQCKFATVSPAMAGTTATVKAGDKIVLSYSVRFRTN